MARKRKKQRGKRHPLKGSAHQPQSNSPELGFVDVRSLIDRGLYADARREIVKLLDGANDSLLAQIHNDLVALSALEGDTDAARTGFQRALELDATFNEARENLALLDVELDSERDRTSHSRRSNLVDKSRTPRPTRIAILSLLFNWPSTGGGIVHTMELVHFLQRAGYDVRHFVARNLGWGVGRISDPLPYVPEVLEFGADDWRCDRIQDRFRQAVVAYQPDHVIITDSWNFKPRLAEAVRGFPFLLRLQAQECLCPLNNLRLLPGFVQCMHHQLADPLHCASCAGQWAQHSGSLHQAERELAGVGTEEYTRVLRQAFLEAEAVLVVNPLNAALVGPYCRKVCVIPSGFDAARFPRSLAVETDVLAAGRKTRFMMAGLIDDPSKGFDVLHSACNRLWKRRQDFELWVTADPPGRKDEFTHYVGWLSQRDLPARLREADVIVVPPVAQDALGRTAVEAMGAGRPVVASRLGGLPFTVADGAGLLFEPGNADELAESLELLLDDPALRSQLGRMGRRRFESHYTWESIIEGHYRPLLAPRESGNGDSKLYSPEFAPTVGEDRICEEASGFFGISFAEARDAFNWYGKLKESHDYARLLGEYKTLASEEACLLGLVMSRLRPEVIFEVGTQHGKSTRRILDLVSALGLKSQLVCYDLVDDLMHVRREEVDLRLEDLTGRFREAVLQSSAGGMIFLDCHGYRLLKEAIEETLAMPGSWVLAIHDCCPGLCNPRMALSKDDVHVTSLTGIWERHVLAEVFGVSDPLSSDLDDRESQTHRLKIFSTRHGLAIMAPRELFRKSVEKAE